MSKDELNYLNRFWVGFSIANLVWAVLHLLGWKL